MSLLPEKISNEAKVGGLLAVTAMLAVLFAWIIGIQNPFRASVDFYVTYNFAGGIEVGSPVRVSGIKVGKVEKIEFFVPENPKAVAVREPGSAEAREDQAIVPLRLKISIRRDAAEGVKRDSRFYVNLAGIIGERYIEITPGSREAPRLMGGDVIAGVDPPRLDQLISQSFNLAGKMLKILEENEGDITKSIELLYKLSVNVNKTVETIDKSKVFHTDLSHLVNNLIQITSDVRKITDEIHSPEGEKTLALLHNLLWRLEPLDSKAIKEFLQKEGIRTKLF
jgi:phospholipid/cholesterol/gamma-HCH transport system substrate-binding protein